jgi:hypothetical protein
VNGKIRTAEMKLIFQISRDSAGQKSKLVPLVRKFSNQILQEIKAFSALFREFKGVEVCRFRQDDDYLYRDIPRTWDGLIQKLVEFFKANLAPRIETR